MVFATCLMLVVSAAFTLGLQLYSLSRPPKSTYSANPAELNLKYEEVQIPTDDADVLVSGWFIPAKNGSNSVVLGLHGYGSNKAEVLPRLAFLADRYNLLLIDFRYFGDSTGGYTTLGVEEMSEVRGSMNWLRERGYSDIGLYGMSLGGGMSLITMSEFGDAKCGVIESPFVDLRQVVRDSFENFGFLADHATDGALLMARLAGFDARGDFIYSLLFGLRKPVLVVRPMEDRVVSPEHLDRLQEVLANDANAEYWFLPGKGYGELGEGYTTRLGLFFEGCLFGQRVSLE